MAECEDFGSWVYPWIPDSDKEVNYKFKPLELPLDDGSAVKYRPCVVSKRIDWAERFRRLGVAVCDETGYWPAGCDVEDWGKAHGSMKLITQEAGPQTLLSWYGDTEVNLIPYQTVNPLPHPFWRWRIIVLPGGVEEREPPAEPNPGICTPPKCTGPFGYNDGTVMLYGNITKAGVCMGMPDSFYFLGFSGHIRHLQFSVVRDGTIGTELWLCPAWN